MIYDSFGPVKIVRRATVADVKGFSQCAIDAVKRGSLCWVEGGEGACVMLNLKSLTADGGWAEIRAACVAVDPDWFKDSWCA